MVVIVDDDTEPFAARMAQLGARLVKGSKRDIETLRAAEIERAEALALTDSDDVGNIHAALAAQEINPQLRLVVRMYNRRLTPRIDVLFDHCTVLSPSEIAAPAFVSAAIDDSQVFPIAGRVLQAGPKGTVRNVLMPLARSRRNEKKDPELLPDEVEGANLFLGQPLDNNHELTQLTRPSSGNGSAGEEPFKPNAARMRWRRFLGVMSAIFGLRLRILSAVLALVLLVTTSIYHYAWELHWVDAFYRTVTVVTATGYDNLLGRHDVPAGMKLFSAGIVIVGVFLIALLTAIVVDDLIGARLGQRLGLSVGRPRNHVVVCGLGSVGLGVVERLVQGGVAVVAVDQVPDSARMARARRLGVAVIYGDASKEETLNAAHVATARCVIAITSNDVTNLEVGLAARALRPDMRVVLRVFDNDLARRVDRRLGLTNSRSVSHAAAPVFAAAMLGREILQVIPYGRRVLLVAELPLPPVAGPQTIRSLAWRKAVSCASSPISEVSLLPGGPRSKRRWRPTID